MWSQLGDTLPEDLIYQTLIEYDADPSPEKLNLSLGAYRTSAGEPFIFRSVREAERRLVENRYREHEYRIGGHSEFVSLTKRLLFDATDNKVEKAVLSRVAGV